MHGEALGHDASHGGARSGRPGVPEGASRPTGCRRGRRAAAGGPSSPPRPLRRSPPGPGARARDVRGAGRGHGPGDVGTRPPAVAHAGLVHVPAGRRCRRVPDVQGEAFDALGRAGDQSRDGALRQMHAERVGQRLPQPPQRDQPGNAHTDDQGGQPRAVDGRGRHALGKGRAGLRPCEAGRTHRCPRCPAASSGGGGGRSRTRPAPRTRRTSRHPARRRMRRRPRDGGPRRGRGPSRRASVPPAWPLCPPGCRPLSCRRDRWRSSGASAVGVASPSRDGGLPLLELSSPSRRSSSEMRAAWFAMRSAWAAPVARSSAIRESRHASAAVRSDVPFSGRPEPSQVPGSASMTVPYSALAAASAVLVGRPLGHAAPIARQDHDGCAAGRVPAWREAEQLPRVSESVMAPALRMPRVSAGPGARAGMQGGEVSCRQRSTANAHGRPLCGPSGCIAQGAAGMAQSRRRRHQPACLPAGFRHPDPCLGRLEIVQRMPDGAMNIGRQERA